MKKERRSARRVKVNLDGRWEGVLGKDKGTISSLSRNGAFILAGGLVELKELVWLEIALPDQAPVHFWAEVVDTAQEIGFAVRFNSGSEDDQARLDQFIEGILQKPPQNEARDKSKFRV